jgi:hypothetical protein
MGNDRLSSGASRAQLFATRSVGDTATVQSGRCCFETGPAPSANGEDGLMRRRIGKRSASGTRDCRRRRPEVRWQDALCAADELLEGSKATVSDLRDYEPVMLLLCISAERAAGEQRQVRGVYALRTLCASSCVTAWATRPGAHLAAGPG